MKRMVVIGTVFVLGAAAIVVTLRAFAQSDFFQVRRVEIRGARYLDPAEAVAALDLESGANLFDRTAGMADRVRQVPGVSEVEVGRRWPGTLVVTVVEWAPVALTARREGLALMDRRGRILPFDPTRDPQRLPVAEADSSVALVLGRVLETEPALFHLIDRAARVRGAVALYAGDHRYLVRSDPATEAIQDLAAVIRDLRERGYSYGELDARFASRVFVRMRWS